MTGRTARKMQPQQCAWLQTATRGNCADVLLSKVCDASMFSSHRQHLFVPAVTAVHAFKSTRCSTAALSRATRSCEGWPALGRAAAWRRGKPGAYNVCACARGKHGSKKRAGAMAPDASRGQAVGKGGGRENGCMRAPGSAGRRRNAWQRSRRRFPPSEVSVVSRVSRVSSKSVESVQWVQWPLPILPLATLLTPLTTAPCRWALHSLDFITHYGTLPLACPLKRASMKRGEREAAPRRSQRRSRPPLTGLAASSAGALSRRMPDQSNRLGLRLGLGLGLGLGLAEQEDT